MTINNINQIKANLDLNKIGMRGEVNQKEDDSSIFELTKETSENASEIGLEGNKIPDDIKEQLEEYIENNKLSDVQKKEIEEIFKKALENVKYEEKITDLTVRDYEKMFPVVGGSLHWHVEHPTTIEFKEHDKEMDKIEEEYVKNNPEPETSESDPMGKYRDPEYSKWAHEKLKYMAEQEKIYRESHPEYSKQAEAYEHQRFIAMTMT